MIERQVRYNLKTTSTAEQDFYTRHRWTFLIINEPREISRIRERVYQQLEPIVDFRTLGEDLIPNSGGLHYDIFSFSSIKGKIEYPEKIYDNPKKFKKDRDLNERDEMGLANYLQPILEGRK